MKFAKTPKFDADWAGLPDRHRKIFSGLMPAFSQGCDRFADTKNRASWPASLRVRPMSGHPGVWEMTWSFSGPDGRATFQFHTLTTGETAVLWRRIGLHGIYTAP